MEGYAVKDVYLREKAPLEGLVAVAALQLTDTLVHRRAGTANAVTEG